MESASGVLFGMFRGSEQHGPWVVACLQGSWSRLLGDRLAAVCTPVAWERGRLRIEARDPAWQVTLDGMKPDLLRRLREATAGEVTQLDFCTRSAPETERD